MVTLCGTNAKSNSGHSSRNLSSIQRRLKCSQNRVAVLKAKLEQQEQELGQANQHLKDTTRALKIARAELAMRSTMEQCTVAPPIERELPMRGFQFNARMIATAIELGKRVGFRAASDILTTIFDSLDIEIKVPSHDAIEQWTLRLGVGLMKDTFKPGQRVLWMADHSSQVGKERLLLIIGVALEDLPPPGQSLTFENLKVLAVVPGVSWKKEDVEREYLALAKQIGAPAYLLCDGAVELRDPAEKLEFNGEKTIVLGDLKHRAANALEKEVGRGERFKAFLNDVGLTRNRIQQTELDLFAPPALRSKSRFMNLGPLITWATMVLYHLNNPEGDAQKEITKERMELKVGWLRGYAKELEEWKQCQETIDRILSVINLQGLDAKTRELVEQSLSQHNPNWKNEDCSAARIAENLVTWIQESSEKLKEGERGWLSTEILESLLGRFKQMERQHSKGGYTRLIAAIPTLCIQATKQLVQSVFQTLNSKETLDWLKKSLGKTLTARRNAAYRESRAALLDP